MGVCVPRVGAWIPRRVRQWFIISLSLTGTPDPPHSLRVVTENLGVCVPGVGAWVPRRVRTVVHHLSFSYRDSRLTLRLFLFTSDLTSLLPAGLQKVMYRGNRVWVVETRLSSPGILHHSGAQEGLGSHSLRVLQRTWESVFLEWKPGFPGVYPQWFIISLTLSGYPDPPHSLRMLQHSWESVFLEWEPGFPGGYPQWFIISLSLTGTPDPPHSQGDPAFMGVCVPGVGVWVPRRVPTVVHHLSFSYRDSRRTPFCQGSPAFIGVSVLGVGAWVPRRVPTMVDHLLLFLLTGTPDPPHSLRVLQHSWESVFLEWEPGFPGGYPQWFVISYSSDKQYEPRLVVQPPEAIRYNITGEFTCTDSRYTCTDGKYTCTTGSSSNLPRQSATTSQV